MERRVRWRWDEGVYKEARPPSYLVERTFAPKGGRIREGHGKGIRGR